MGFASWQRYCTASSSGRQPNFAALNKGRHLCSAGRPSGWALAHIIVKFQASYSELDVDWVHPWVGLGQALISCANYWQEESDFYRHIAHRILLTFNSKSCFRHKAQIYILFSFDAYTYLYQIVF